MGFLLYSVMFVQGNRLFVGKHLYVDTENARVLGVGFEGYGGLTLLALLGRPPIAARERPPSGVAGNGGRRGAPN
jgi:hypothetical protein